MSLTEGAAGSASAWIGGTLAEPVQRQWHTLSLLRTAGSLTRPVGCHGWLAHPCFGTAGQANRGTQLAVNRGEGDSPIFADTKIGTIPAILRVSDYQASLRTGPFGMPRCCKTA